MGVIWTVMYQGCFVPMAETSSFFPWLQSPFKPPFPSSVVWRLSWTCHHLWMHSWWFTCGVGWGLLCWGTLFMELLGRKHSCSSYSTCLWQVCTSGFVLPGIWVERLCCCLSWCHVSPFGFSIWCFDFSKNSLFCFDCFLGFCLPWLGRKVSGNAFNIKKSFLLGKKAFYKNTSRSKTTDLNYFDVACQQPYIIFFQFYQGSSLTCGFVTVKKSVVEHRLKWLPVSQCYVSWKS